MRGKKVCVPKLGLSLLALCSKFHFSREESFGSIWWVGGLAWGAGVRQINPPAPVDKHIPAPGVIGVLQFYSPRTSVSAAEVRNHNTAVM